MIRFIKSLQFIFQQDCWHRSFPTSKNLDIEINKMLDKGIIFTNINTKAGFADLGWMRNIWIESYPYAFCSYNTRGSKDRYYMCENTYMPRRITCKRVKKILEQQGVDV